MQRYLQQLIEDLETAAKNPPTLPYYEVPPHMADDPAMAELALTPFRSIAEWTGISREVFPDITDLEGGQWEMVNEAIFKVFEALHIELIDAPADLPPEILYETLTTNWDFPVQYLPMSGMDLELCTNDPETCPYGEYCDCASDSEWAAPEIYNGFYDDDGTKIDPESVPVPNLCIICRRYTLGDWEEDLLCLMNRYDQRNDSNFKCGEFEKL